MAIYAKINHRFIKMCVNIICARISLVLKFPQYKLQILKMKWI